jgi:hypothetical protein
MGDRRRVVVCALVGIPICLLPACGPAGLLQTQGVEIGSAIKVMVKDLQDAEAQCSADAGHYAACDAAVATMLADLPKLRSAASRWLPGPSELIAKDALTAAIDGGLEPSKNVRDVRVMRLLLERAQTYMAALPTPRVSGSGIATTRIPVVQPTVTIPAGYAMRMSVMLPPLSVETGAAGNSCLTPALDPCYVDVLTAKAGLERVVGAVAGVIVSPADVPVDALIRPVLNDLTTSLTRAALSTLNAGMAVDPAVATQWARSSDFLNTAANQLRQ